MGVIVPATLFVVLVLHRTGVFSGSLKPWRMHIGALAVIIAIVPWFVWESLHPQIFDATARGKKLDYEFADPLYAARFAAVNNANTS